MIQPVQLRPKRLCNFIGKAQIIKTIKIALEAARKTNSNFDHCLFYGPPGVGKTTLAFIIANEMKSKIKVVQAINIQSPTDLVSILNNIQDFDVLFIDEIHSLNRNVCEMLYSVLEDNVLDIVIGKNYNSKIVRLNLPKFTIIVATTHLGMLSNALEDRFNYQFFIDTYADNELKQIVLQTIKNYNFKLNEKEIDLIIKNLRGIPRNANRIIKQINNYYILDKKTSVKQIIKEAGYVLNGLTEIDLKYMFYLYDLPGKTASLKSISQGINLDEITIVEKIEPFLIKLKFLIKTSKGRKLTNYGCDLIDEKNLLSLTMQKTNKNF